MWASECTFATGKLHQVINRTGGNGVKFPGYSWAYRPCKLRHHKFTNQTLEPGLPAGTFRTQPNGRKHKILHFIEVAMSDFYQLFDNKKPHLKTGKSCYYNSWI